VQEVQRDGSVTGKINEKEEGRMMNYAKYQKKAIQMYGREIGELFVQDAVAGIPYAVNAMKRIRKQRLKK